jgi:HD-like signal output (HDOD) protein
MVKDITTDLLLKRLESGYSLPALSPLVMKILELAAEENCSAKDLAEQIERDPSLAVRLLKLANSAFFRQIQPVTTLNQAVMRLGFQHLRIMVLSISLRDTFPMGKAGPLDYAEFWRISLYRAVIAKSLAARLKMWDPEEAFLAGLVMEIGLLIFIDLFVKGKDEEISLKIDPLEGLIAWEKKAYGFDHRQVGEAALRHWNFPEHMVLCQQAFKVSDTHMSSHPLARICELARILSKIVSRDSETFYTPYVEAGEWPGLDSSVINGVLVESFNHVQDISDSLKVEMNKDKDLMEIADKARNALSRISEKLSKGRGDAEPASPPTFDTLDEDPNSAAYTLQAVAHEIRNPLVAVGGFARKLAASLNPDSTEGKYVDIILKEASRLEKVLSEMMKKTPAKRPDEM